MQGVVQKGSQYEALVLDPKSEKEGPNASLVDALQDWWTARYPDPSVPLKLAAPIQRSRPLRKVEEIQGHEFFDLNAMVQHSVHSTCSSFAFILLRSPIFAQPLT